MGKMVVVHNEAGLGNQMMDYAEYWIIKQLNPNQDVYLENIVFEITECSEAVSLWNGFELDRVFGIDSDSINIKSIMTDDDYRKVVENVRKSEFWKYDWQYAQAIIKAISKQLKYNPINCCDSGLGLKKDNYITRQIGRIRRKICPKFNIRNEKYLLDENKDYYCGHSFPLINPSLDFTQFRDSILDIFSFPKIEEEDKNNNYYYQKITNANAVGIHVRRGDLLVYNGQYYENDYFSRAVKYIKDRIDDPSFFVVSDESSREWCKGHLSSLGLNDEDTVVFIEGNDGENSFRDMQLLSICKHQIITNSSFGWWAQYLNQNPDKITISPENTFNTSVWI